MTKRTTKKALVLSLLSLLLCCSMLVGTTFAWFTDSVTSGQNKIIAGNLDVDVYYGDPAAAQSIEDVDTLFNDVTLWEPGAVAWENLTVVNLGTLALRYELAVNFEDKNAVKGTGAKLSEALKVAVVDPIAANATREQVLTAAGTGTALASFTENGKLLPKGSTQTAEGEDVEKKTYGIVIWWEPSSEDNKWNIQNGAETTDGEPLQIDLGIELLATQLTHEEDSFGSDYDDAAWVTANADAVVKDATELAAALQEGGLIALSNSIDGDVTLEGVADDTILNFAGNTINGTVTVAEGEKITINGQGGVAATGTASALKVEKGADVTISGGTFTSENTAITVSNRTEAPATITIDEGTVITAPTIISLNQTSNYAGTEIVINGGEFNSTYTKSDARPIKVHGGDVTINGGTFTIDNPTGGNCYFIDVSSAYNTANDGTNKYVAGNVEINGGTFKSNVSYTRAVYCSVSRGHTLGTVVINGGHYEFTADNSYLVDVPGNVVVNDCTYIGVKTANVFNISSTNPADQTITVNGGNYTVRTSPAGCFNYSYADRVILKGGTINSNKKLADSLAAGYKVVDNGNGTYSIVEE